MSILFIMIPISLALAFVFLALFIWSNNSGQYDDLVSPSLTILEENNKNQNKEEDNERRRI